MVNDSIIDFLWENFTIIFKSMFLAIDQQVYGIISLLYQKFIVLASLRIGNDSMFQTFADSIYTLIVIFALFLLAYSLLKNMINADIKKSGSEIKELIINTITSIVLVLAVPTVFQFIYGAQNAILKHNVIGRIVSPMTKNIDFKSDGILANCLDVENQTDDGEDQDEVKLRCYGNMASVIMFQGFFHPNMQYFETDSNASFSDQFAAAAQQITAYDSNSPFWDFMRVLNKATGGTIIIDIISKVVNSTSEITLADAYNYAIVRGDFRSFSGFQSAIIEGRIDYTWGVSTLAGIFAAYVLFLYCLDVAVRAIKLAFYQIIAPIPIMLRITKKKDIFNNWLGAVTRCYLEVFTRLIVLYFGMYLISNVFALLFEALDSNNIAYNIWSGGRSAFDIGGKLSLWLLVKANIVLAVFAFMKKAPEIVQEIFPSKNKFSLKLWDHLKDGLAIPATAAGFVGGTIAGGGNPLAGFRAAKKGWNDSSLKGIGSEFKRRQDYLDAVQKGVTPKDMFIDKARGMVGLDSQADERLRTIDKQAESVKNETGRDIKYTGSDGKTKVVSANSSVDLDKSDVELMEVQIADNKRKVVASNNKKVAIDKKMETGNAQIQWKSNVKSEAEKKIDEEGSKITHTISYVQHEYKRDSNGEIINQNGAPVVISTPKEFTGTYAQINEFVMHDLPPEERKNIKLNDIRDEMIKKYVRDENAKSNTKIQTDIESGYRSIINNQGFKFKFKDGNQIKDGIITVTYDASTNKYETRRSEIDSLGNIIAGTTREITDDKGNVLTEDYDIIDTIDKIAKSSNNIYRLEKQDIDEKEIQGLLTQNSDLQSLIDSVNDIKEAERKSVRQRQLEASKAYTAKRNNGGN